MTRILLFFLFSISLATALPSDAYSQSKGDNEKIKSRLSTFFLNYESDEDISAGQKPVYRQWSSEYAADT